MNDFADAMLHEAAYACSNVLSAAIYPSKLADLLTETQAPDSASLDDLAPPKATDTIANSASSIK